MRIFFHTLGCKVNQYETQALETILTQRGHEISPQPEECDALIINTCAVTAESGHKSRQAIRRLKAKNPDAVAAVCGCLSQVDTDTIEDLGVDIIYGSGDRLKFVEDLEKSVSGRMRIVTVDDAMGRRAFEDLPAGSMHGRTRAMLKIQDGCNNFCSYCIIPYARGPIRSLPLNRIVEKTEELKNLGFNEIVVTGIEIASYGKDLKDGSALIDAVCAVADAAGDEVRIRLGSLEPGVVTEDFCIRLKEKGNICPYFHLSLQSGSAGVLERMRRKYSPEMFYRSAELLRRYFPDCGLTADLIVGFPGETEEEFAETLAFIERCAFSSMHIFPYSRRPGTRAADMPGQITNAVKRERAGRAAEVAGRMEASFLQNCVGTEQQVLFETESGGVSRGHAGNYCEVAVEARDLKNNVLNVQISHAKDGILWGNISCN